MSSSYTWCNFTKVTHLLNSRSLFTFNGEKQTNVMSSIFCPKIYELFARTLIPLTTTLSLIFYPCKPSDLETL